MPSEAHSSTAAVRLRSDEASRPFLQVLDGPARGRRLPLGDRVTIGRSSRCDLTLAHQLVSRMHAEVVRQDDTYLLRDLGSVNGTFINGQQVSTAELQDGDRIGLGEFTIGVHLDERDSPSTDSYVILSPAAPLGTPRRIQGQASALPRSLLSGDSARAERARVRLETLVGVTHNLAQLRDLETLYPMVVDEVLRAVPAERIAFFEPTPGGALEPRVARHASEAGAPVEVSTAVLQEVASQRVCLLSYDAMCDPAFADAPSITSQQIHSVLCVPIESGPDLLGVLYLDAPGRQGAFTEEDLHFVSGVASVAAVAITNAVALAKIRSTAQELNRTYLSMLAVLGNAIEARDHYTIGHTWRVARFAQAIARRLGWSEEKVDELEVGGVLHDIGKIGVPDSILTKSGPLSPDEEEQMMRHPEIGARMLRDVPTLHHVLPYVLHHHECYDGSGYPNSLAEEAIPVEARLLAVADALDAMTSDRPYRAGLDPAAAIAEIVDRAGSQFDPVVVEALAAAYEAGDLSPYLRDDVLEQQAVCPHCSAIQTPDHQALARGQIRCPTCNRLLTLRVEGRRVVAALA